MTPLAPCPGCRRHVRVGEPVCPFCAAAVGHLTAPAAPPARRATSRRAWLLGAAMLATGAACGGDTGEAVGTHEEPGTGTDSTAGGEDDGNAEIERTGGDPADADAGTSAAPPPGGDVVALYGVAPPPED